MILSRNLPFADEIVLDYVVEFLRLSHTAGERFSVRDGINVGRYALKLLSAQAEPSPSEVLAGVSSAVRLILGEDALVYLLGVPKAR